MGKYFCLVESPTRYSKCYEVDTTSALKAAYRLGKAEAGETVTIERKRTGVVLSRAMWSSEDRCYYSVHVRNPLKEAKAAQKRWEEAVELLKKRRGEAE